MERFRLPFFLGCLVLVGMKASPEPAGYLPALRHYIELTPVQISSLLASNRVYSSFLLARERQVEDLNEQVKDPHHALSWATWESSIPAACGEIARFAAQIHLRNISLLREAQRAKLSDLLAAAPHATFQQEALLTEARSGNLLAQPATIAGVTREISAACRYEK